MIKVLANSLPGRARFLACRQMHHRHVFAWLSSSMCMEIEEGKERAGSLLSLFVMSLILLDQDSIFMTSFNLNYLLRGATSKYSSFKSHGFNIGTLGGHKHSIHYKCKCHFILLWRKIQGLGSEKAHLYNHSLRYISQGCPHSSLGLEYLLG